jgi:UDP:flavonoid glycosyltransferase YjiC (YdhE family)
VPLVIVPVFADQFENARRVALAGAGIVVQRSNADPASARTTVDRADSPRINAAVEEVLRDASFRQRARSIAAEMAATATVEDALAVVSRSS